MRRRLISSVLLCGVALGLVAAGPVFAAAVQESARQVPVAYDVDVVVAGGGAAGVAAALEAARNGASVFVAAPRNYLGDDLCASYRLWLEADETPASPLAQALFSEVAQWRGLRFSYEADKPSASRHADTEPPSVLANRIWTDAYNESVQYDGDVTITADLGQQQALAQIRVMVFQSVGDFQIDSIAVSASADRQQWQPVVTLTSPELGKGSYVESALELAAPVSAETRYLRFAVKKAAAAKRVLLGEIMIEPRPGPDAAPAEGVRMATPMQVKRGLDQALLDAHVPFLYGCFATDVLRDAAGNPAGIVMANKAGRQAVRAKVIIDATERGTVARLAGAKFAPYPSGLQTFTRVVIGGEPRVSKQIQARRIGLRSPLGGKPPLGFGKGKNNAGARVNAPMGSEYKELLEYTLCLQMRDGSVAAFAAAEQMARDLTFQPEQVDESETLFQVPPDPMQGRAQHDGAWVGADKVNLDCFRPAGVERLFVLGGCADVARDAAARMLRPLQMLDVGVRIGAAAAAEAKGLGKPENVRLPGTPATDPVPGDTGEGLSGLRPVSAPDAPAVVVAEPRGVPVWGEYDVVVVGGGTSGAPAGVGAVKQGAKTLVVESLQALGGVATTGLIGMYCAGYRKGFTATTEAGVKSLGCASYIVGKAEWWRREIRLAGGDIWFGALGCGAVIDKGRVKGVVVATPQGRGVVLAKVVIDGTGNADIAAAAGAQCRHLGEATIALQGAGLPYRELGASYINTDWTYVDDTDVVDAWSAFVVARKKYPNAYDLGQLIDTRERRQIVGDYELSPLDIVNQRTFPDTIGLSNGGILDTHGFTVHPFFYVNNWRGGITSTPYRCLLPKGLDGILVVGLGLSAHRDAIPSIRMQPCMQNLGYAAGVAAALAAKANVGQRQVDVKAVQGHLVEAGCLTPEVPSQTDSFPLPEPKLRAAVDTLLATDYSGLAVIMAEWERTAPLLRQAYAAPDTPAAGKLRCAHVLGLMGDATGVETLVAKVNGISELDKENIEDYFPCVTWLDSYILALGQTHDARATQPILAKVALLARGDNHRTSHVLAVALALETLADPAAAKPLADLLRKAMASGAAQTELDAPGDKATGPQRPRSGQMTLLLASALYRCGDCEGLAARVLKEFEGDLRGPYARRAHAVLSR